MVSCISSVMGAMCVPEMKEAMGIASIGTAATASTVICMSDSEICFQPREARFHLVNYLLQLGG